MSGEELCPRPLSIIKRWYPDIAKYINHIAIRAIIKKNIGETVMPKTNMKKIGQADIAYPKMPLNLTPEIQKLWKKVIKTKTADFWQSSDVELVTSYCHALHDRNVAAALIDKHGAIIIDKYEKMYSNPACLLKSKALGLIAMYQTKLRLCPSSRMKQENKKNTQSGIQPEVQTPLMRLLAS